MDDEHQHRNLGHEHREDRPGDQLKLQTADRGDNEEHSPHRRGDQADGHIQHETHGEVERVDAELVRQRGQDGYQEDDRGQDINESAAEEDENGHEPHDDHGAGRHLADGQGNRLGNLQDRQEPGEEGRHGDDEQGRRGDEAALKKHLRDEPEIQLPGNEEAYKEGIDDRHGRRFGRRKDPAQDAADDDTRHHQGRQGLPEAPQADGPARLFTGKPIPMPDRDDVIGHSQGPTQEDARHDPCHEQTGHGDPAVAHGVDDHDDGRGYNGPERGRRRRECRRVVRVVTGPLHHPHQDRPRTGGIGEGGTADPGENHVGQDIHMSQPAPDVAHEIVGEAQDVGGNAAGRHQIGGEDEKGDGHEGKGVDAVEKALRH